MKAVKSLRTIAPPHGQRNWRRIRNREWRRKARWHLRLGLWDGLPRQPRTIGDDIV